MSEIAKSDFGLCPACGVRVERGDWITRRGVETIHTGCASWRGHNKAPSDIAQSGFLFSDPDQATIEHAQTVLGITRMSFDGPSAMQIDVPRLAGQLAKVYSLMSDGCYRTLRQIANDTGCLETSASARLRDLRKARFGAHEVVSRQVADSTTVFEYRLIIKEARGITNGQRAA